MIPRLDRLKDKLTAWKQKTFNLEDTGFYLLSVSGFGIITVLFLGGILIAFATNKFSGAWLVDFLNMWTAAKLELSGRVRDLFSLQLYLADQQRLIGHPIPHIRWLGSDKLYDWTPMFNWSYPPHILPLIAPLGLLSYPAAYLVWLGVTFAFYCLAIAGWRPRPLFLVLLLLVAPSTAMNVYLGQNGFLTSALLVGGLRLLEKRPGYSGILFGLLTIKPQLGLLVPIALVVKRAWKTIFVALLTTAALVYLSIFLFGLDVWKIYFLKTTLIQKNILEDPNLKILMVSFFEALRGRLAPVWLAYIFHGAIAIFVALYVARMLAGPADKDRKIALFLTGTMLVSPYIFVYDMAMTSAAVICLLAARPRPWKIRVEDAILVCIWFLPMCGFSGHIGMFDFVPEGLLFFFLIQIYLIKRDAMLQQQPQALPALCPSAAPDNKIGI